MATEIVTATATATVTATKARGWQIPCPHCGDLPDGGLLIELVDVVVRCPACGAEVTRADLELLIDDARRLITWLDAAATV
jgi:uncharacterized protein (DUF983 family)